MKRTLSVLLAIFMLIPVFACFAFAGDEGHVAPLAQADTHEGTNIASQATLEYSGTITGKYDPNKLVDGDTTTGTKTGRTSEYTFALAYDKIYYFSEVVVYLNGEGTLPDGSSVSQAHTIDEITIKLYKTGEELFTETITTAGETMVVVAPEIAADKIEIYRNQKSTSTSERGNDFYREIETYSVDKEFCDVIKSNIAADARVYAAGTTEGEYCDEWWAWSPKALVDGNKDVGTRSPKGWRYSVFLEFTRDYLISELVLVLNGKGELLGSGYVDEVAMNISQIRVKLYNLEGEMVYDSKDVGVDSTEVKLDPFVEASLIKIEIANGKGEGSEFMWEVETYVEEGNHVFEQTDSQNPTCNRPGYKEYTCDSPECGKVIKKTVPATGFHAYDNGVVTIPATADDNGVLTKTCISCGEKKEFDIPALGHNWNNGVTTDPTCDTEGSTVYTCTGCSVPGCTATYTADVKQALGHDWDDGVITKKATSSSHGEKEFTCFRCNEVEVRKTRILQYTDSTANFEFIDGKYDVVVDYNEEDELYDTSPTAQYPLLPESDGYKLVDDDMTTYWYGPNGTTLTINLDREYIFTKGTLYASGNNTTMMIEWIDAAGKVSSTYTTKWNTITGGPDKNNPISINLSDSLVGGVKAKSIKVIITGAKWPNGWAMSLHDLDFVIHDCTVTEADYILSGSNYKAPTCTEDGYCDAKCPVCENIVKVTLSKENGHKVSNVTTDVEPTCSDVGYGHGTCSICNQNIQNVVIPATGTHVYDKTIEFMPATCGATGISQVVCSGCGRVASQSPIESTGIHTNHWTQDYCSTYTASGKEIFVCKICGLQDSDNGVYEKIIPQKELSNEFLSFEGYSVRTTDFAGIRLTYKIDMEMLAEIEYECDVRIITYVTNSEGVTKEVESYGKYSEDRYAETGEFSVVIKPSSYYDEYEVKTVVRLMNFRGTEYIEFDLGALSTDDNGKISLCEVAESVLASGVQLGKNEKAFYEEIVAGK